MTALALTVTGFLLVVAGVAMVSVPAAVVVAGLVVAGVGLFADLEGGEA